MWKREEAGNRGSGQSTPTGQTAPSHGSELHVHLVRQRQGASNSSLTLHTCQIQSWMTTKKRPSSAPDRAPDAGGRPAAR